MNKEINIESILKRVSGSGGPAGFFYTPPVYENARSYLFLNPVEEVIVCSVDELEKIDELSATHWGFALLDYEAGFMFEKKLNKYFNAKDNSVIRFYFYDKDDVEIFPSYKINFESLYTSDYSINNFKLNITEKEFTSSINKIKKYIEEGDTYQVNYTCKANFDFEGSPEALFKTLLFNQSARYSAFISEGNRIIISVSPELFFRKKGNEIETKPMKGTARRGYNLQNDKEHFNDLLDSEKNKAENLMIVDLLRNDLGKICNYGSVKTEKMFEVEKYESLFQMISTVKGELWNSVKVSDIIKNLFPCGSVTGAPKIRTMEIINELEKSERGIYTGAIGLLLQDEFVFNVAIRTLEIDKELKKGTIGLGSGIVWDSNAEDEFNEVNLKANFLTEPKKDFRLFETMLVENKQISLLKYHLKRLSESAEYFLFRFDEKKILVQINEALEQAIGNEKYRLKLLLDKCGKTEIVISPFPKNPEVIKVVFSNFRIKSDNPFQYFKTTNRELYDSVYKHYNSKGFFDVLYLNEKEVLAEGYITNIFIRKGEKWFTPGISAGILPGVHRKVLIEKLENVEESNLFIKDLKEADEIILTNALRGKIKVDEVYSEENTVKPIWTTK